ncbi:hypothetical protein B0H13DRAFT_2345125 [Mycena leptocephala]|nr:hypothetical protein B0H13DRAFT_2345125 [Mycena leptocephala]
MPLGDSSPPSRETGVFRLHLYGTIPNYPQRLVSQLSTGDKRAAQDMKNTWTCLRLQCTNPDQFVTHLRYKQFAVIHAAAVPAHAVAPSLIHALVEFVHTATLPLSTAALSRTFPFSYDPFLTSPTGKQCPRNTLPLEAPSPAARHRNDTHFLAYLPFTFSPFIFH